MPVEIKELVVKAVVEPSRKTSSKRSRKRSDDWKKEELVAACVREVLKVLRREKER
jgi:hypothetical protein